MRLTEIAAERIVKVTLGLFIIILLLAASTASGQQKTITGVIRNAEDNAPVPQATVTVKGTRTVAVSDDKGIFTINALPNQTLVVTAVGFQAMEKPVGQQTSINFSLASSTAQMENEIASAEGTNLGGEQLHEGPNDYKASNITAAN